MNDDSAEIRSQRRRRGLTQRELAAQTGLSVRTVREVEHGRIGAGSTRRLRAALGMAGGMPDQNTLWASVLGPMSVWRGEVRVAVGSVMQRTVLGVLAASPGQVVTVDELVDLLWGDDPPRSCVNLVHTYVARLRRMLGSGAAIRRDGGGYRLDTDVVGTDATAFDAGMAAAARAESAGVLDVAAARCGDALDLWRGGVLADLGDRIRAHPTVAAWQRRRVAAALDLARLAAAIGEHATAAGRLSVVAECEPLHEALHAALMSLLAASGQQAAALAVHAAIRTRLAEELGVDPGVELSRVQHAVLAARPAARADRRWWGPRGHLAGLIGRDAELSEVAGLLAGNRVLTITGVGGCGKTVLALHVAATHRGGVAVLPLAPLSDGDELVPALAGLLGVAGTATHPLLDAVHAALQAREQLLVLDNAEHLASATAAVVAGLVAACPLLTVLITSRQPLGAPLEVSWQLHPLAAPADADLDSAAAELFRQRARQALPAVDLSDAVAVGRICHRLDGLPLALELAASRVRVLPVRQLADRLDMSLGILSVDGTAAEQRHRTLHSAMDWSCRLLSAHERHALAQLSVFRTGFTLDAAEAVVDVVGGTPADAVVGLVDKSLLVAEQHAGTGRFRLLEVVRSYASTRLAEPDELSESQARHLAYWLARGRALASVPAFGARVTAARSLSWELPDAESVLGWAVAHGRSTDAVELACLLNDCWNVNPGYPARGERWLAEVDRIGDGASARLRALARLYRGQLLGVLARPAESLTVLRRALPDADALARAEHVDLLGVLANMELNLLDPNVVAHVDENTRLIDDLPDEDQRAATLDTALRVAIEWDRGTVVEALAGRLAPLALGR
ncbi:MAG TPA: BTAD domain-containing putative transcriptional regulator, partial [Pseudonocardiaceae bacterium]|nr:BTAD domain-containing putative transcriptional regulator [Pseudonocardiaceae bacterium]